MGNEGKAQIFCYSMDLKTTLELQKLLYHIIFVTLQIFICAAVVSV